jgi:hypothetical protein
MIGTTTDVREDDYSNDRTKHSNQQRSAYEMCQLPRLLDVGVDVCRYALDERVHEPLLCVCVCVCVCVCDVRFQSRFDNQVTS